MSNKRKFPYGLYYQKECLSVSDRKEVMEWLKTIHPIWEKRFSRYKPLPKGEEQRTLLRPVYWLGNWQFACLNYYTPPFGIENRCVRAEKFPDVLDRLVSKVESITKARFHPNDIPEKWQLNTCLVNFYGDRIDGEKRIDCARVGDHRDFEPGPVASLSFGEKAMFQFVETQSKTKKSTVVLNQWLEDGSLQIFGGNRFKRQLFHRVQRVERKRNDNFILNVEGFDVRRVNFTFRYVPVEHFVDYKDLPDDSKQDIREYIEELAKNSKFFAALVK
ncbi:MAG: alpha-ketoglutarate-dependent dioxygenase AlkB [Bacteriovoracia bacterium]